MSALISSAVVLRLMLSGPAYTLDASDTAEQRAELYRPIAEAIAAAAKTKGEAATLVALGRHETNFARFVIEGRCNDGPPGQRCDSGRARGVFQLHEQSCRSAWALPDGSVESLNAEAVCAVRQLRSAQSMCREHSVTPLSGAFSGYAGRGCHWPGADARVKTVSLLLAKWGKS